MFKQLGKYPNDLLDHMILNCNSEVIDYFRAKHGRISFITREPGNFQGSFQLDFHRLKEEKISTLKLNPFSYKERAEIPNVLEFHQECTNLQLFPI